MPENKVNLAASKNNILVWYDSVSSHAATHIHDTPNLAQLAREVVENTDIVGDYLQFHVDFGHTIGTSDLVENSPGDVIVYAKRKNRDSYSVFNKSKSAQPCSLLTVALEKQQDDTYELVSAWIGPSDSPSFPGTDRETADSKEFWSKHSLVWGNQEIQENSETINYPW